MAIKKISYELNPFREFGIKVPKQNKAEALEEIRDYLLEQVLSYVGDGTSPVEGESWKRALSKEYKKKKSEQSSATYANLELTGAMLDALEVKELNSEKLALGIFDADQAPKADGHNNHSGKSELPRRRFIPSEGQSFKKPITQGIKEILMRYSEDGES